MLLLCKNCQEQFDGARKRRLYCDVCLPSQIGWQRRWHGKRILPEQKEEVISAYAHGTPFQKIIDELGVSETTIRRFLIQNGITANRTDAKKINPLSLAEIAYIAGIVDGEGCIAINRRHDRDYRHGYSFTTLIRVTNTYKPLLQWLRAIIGLGSVLWTERITGQRKSAGEWKAHKQQAVQIVEVIMPYLIVKKSQAIILLSMAKLQKENLGRFGKSGIPKELWEKQERYYLEMKSLNQRGGPGWLPKHEEEPTA